MKQSNDDELRAARARGLVEDWESQNALAQPAAPVPGHEAYTRSAAPETERLREAAQAVVDRWVATFGPDGYEMEMPQTLRDLRAAIEAGDDR